MATTPAPGEILCPDPSVHDHSKLISEPASKAALLAAGVTTAERKSGTSESLLTEDGRLSSRGAASSLKYAKAQDLPSFPSRGATSDASLTAAFLAKDHKMQELWQPEASAAGLKAAATAQKDGGKLDLWYPSPSAAGNSAAVMAMRGKDLSPQIDYGYTESGRTNSLVAAKQSHTVGRHRAGSVPTAVPPQYPDSHNSSKNALNAAVVSARTSRMSSDGWDSPANQAARIGNLGGRMDREMFGEHPPVEAVVEEQRHQAALRASAVSMARQMYERSATPTETGSAGAGAEVAHSRNQSSTSQADLKQEAMKYLSLQDAAQKIAQERLAKLDQEMADSRYREYYGYGETSPRKSRMSMRRRPRAASEGEADPDDSDDERNARRIRNQMSQLSSGVNTVDVKQRNQDRAKLMAAAEKQVHARMRDMDEKVFQETGKVSQSMMDEWETKAREKAEADRAERDKNKGMVAIGGGKFMDQAEIEAIAAARLKPTLEEIDDTAAQMRARDEEMKRRADALETSQMDEKMKKSQQKAEFKRIKEQDKAAARKEKDERKAAERAEKEAAKARIAEEKRKSREAKREEVSVLAGGAALGEVAEKVKDDQVKEEEEHQEALEDASVALGEIAGRVKTDREMERRESAAAQQEAGATLAEVAAKVKSNREFEESEDGPGGAVVAVGAAGVAGVAGVAAYEVVGGKDTGPAPNTIGPHESDLANILDPRVKPDPELQRATVTNPETGPAPNTLGPHKSDLANITDPRVQPDPDLPKDIADSRREGDVEQHTEGQVVDTEGPHKSVIANILDPKVESEAQEDQIQEVAPVVVVPGAVVATPTDKGIASPAVAATPDDPKRKSSFFGRMKDKFRSRSDDKSVAQSSAARTEPAPVVVASPAADKDVIEEKDDGEDVDRTMAAEAMVGVGAAGAGIAAAVAVASPDKGEGVAPDEVSSISTHEEPAQGELEQYTTTSEQNTGEHNFAQSSPQGLAPPQRPDLERHISTIEDSSSEDELVDSDDEDGGERGRVRGVDVAPEPTTTTTTTTGPIIVEDSAETAPPVAPTEPIATKEGELETTGTNTNEFGAYERAGKGRVATEGELENKFATYELNDPDPETTEAMKQNIRQVEREKVEVYGIAPEQPKEKEGLLQKVLSPFKSKDEEGGTDTAAAEDQPRSPVSPIQPEEEIAADDPTLVSSTPEVPVAVVASSAPAASEIQTPTASEDDPSLSSSQQPQKERKGIKGIFSKLTSRPENKLTKRGGGRDGSPSSASAAGVVESEKSEGAAGAGAAAFVGGAKLTGGDDKDGVIRPVTSTSTGVADDLGIIDGTVGETQGGGGSIARDESPSSFTRHEEELADPDDVSSSGAEEEEVMRGRAGRLARRLGLTRGSKGKEQQLVASDEYSNIPASGGTTGAEAGGEQQVEEARDQFDESLAPPPAFAGQVKNENQSPARETKFQEEF